MPEESRPWPGTTVGDAGPYSDDDWDDIWEVLYGSGLAPYNDRGVIRNWANELEITASGLNTVEMNVGAALVHGKFYKYTGFPLALNIPNSVGAWREDLVCLRSDWTPQTIRLHRHPNPADAPATYPAPLQNDGVEWEIPLAAVRVDGGGNILSVTELRDYVSDLMQTKQDFFRAFEGTGFGTREFAGWHEGVLLNLATEQAGIEFMVPLDFKSLVSAHVRLITQMPGGPAGTFDWTADTSWGACNESMATHTDTDTADGVDAVADDRILCIDVSNALDSASLLAEDQVGLRFLLDALGGNCTGIYILGLDFRYK